MSDLGYNVWGVVASVLGTLGLIPVLYDLMKRRMPTERLRRLEADLKTTEDMLNNGVEEGLLDPEKFRGLMRTTKISVEELQEQVYTATSGTEEFRNWRNGLSARVDVLIHQVYKIRAMIAKSSSEARKQLASTENVPDLDSPSKEPYIAELAVPVAEETPPSSSSATSLTDMPSTSLSTNAAISLSHASSISANDVVVSLPTKSATVFHVSPPLPRSGYADPTRTQSPVRHFLTVTLAISGSGGNVLPLDVRSSYGLAGS